jgi:hypothetical protein
VQMPAAHGFEQHLIPASSGSSTNASVRMLQQSLGYSIALGWAEQRKTSSGKAGEMAEVRELARVDLHRVDALLVLSGLEWCLTRSSSRRLLARISLVLARRLSAKSSVSKSAIYSH